MQDIFRPQIYSNLNIYIYTHNNFAENLIDVDKS